MLLAEGRTQDPARPHGEKAEPGEARAAEDGGTEEARLLERARGGDSAAYAWLLERYRERVVRLAAHVLRRADEAEDVAQEAFILAFRKLDQYRGDGAFFTWLYQITLRICFSRRRLLRWRAEAPGDAPHEHDESRLSGGDPAGPAQTRILVAALLDRLSPPVRAALVLRELEGLEYEEIARILKIPAGTVRSRLNAARTRFRILWLEANEEADHV